MNKKIIDLSPTILKIISYLSIILIIFNIVLDLTYTGEIKNITFLILLFIFVNILKNTNNSLYIKI